MAKVSAATRASGSSAKNASRIAIYKEGIDLKKGEKWNSAMDWHSDTLEKFHKVFPKRIKKIDSFSIVEEA